MKRELVLRWLFYFVGLIVLSFGVSLTIEGKVLGIGPWDAFHYGLYMLLGLTVGQWAIIVGAVIVGLTSLFTKAWPKIGAVLNMLLIGIFIDFFTYILPDPETYISSTVVFVIGVIFIGYGVGIYVSADLGAGPRDSLMLLISEKTGWNVQWVRNGMEPDDFIDRLAARRADRHRYCFNRHFNRPDFAVFFAAVQTAFKSSNGRKAHQSLPSLYICR